MTEEQKKFYQILQFLVFTLLFGEPFEEVSQQPEIKIFLEKLKIKIEKPSDLLFYLANFFPELDPKDPDFLKRVYLKINEILIQETSSPRNLPENLQEIVKAYEEYLENQENVLGFDSSFQEYRQRIKEILEKRRLNPLTARIFSLKIARECIEKITSTISSSFFKREPPLERYKEEIIIPVLKSLLPSFSPQEVVDEITTATYPLAAKVAVVSRPITVSSLISSSLFSYLSQGVDLSLKKYDLSQEEITQINQKIVSAIIEKIKTGEISTRSPQKSSQKLVEILDSISLSHPKIPEVAQEILQQIEPALILIEEDLERWREAVFSEIKELSLKKPPEEIKILVQKITNRIFDFHSKFSQFIGPEKLGNFLEEELLPFVPPEGLISSAKRIIQKVTSWSTKEGLEKVSFFFLKFKPTPQRFLLSLVVKPLQGLISLAPQEYQEQHLGLVYLAKGFTPKIVEEIVVSLENIYPQSSRLLFWKNIQKAIFQESPFYLKIFSRFYSPSFLKPSFLIKFVTQKIKIPENPLIKILTFGKIKSFYQIKRAFWKFFKNTKIGKLLGQGAIKILTKIGSWGVKKLGIKVGLSTIVSFFSTPLGGIVTFILTSLPSLFKKFFKKIKESPEIGIIFGSSLILLGFFLPLGTFLGPTLITAGILSLLLGILSKGTPFLGFLAGKLGSFLMGIGNTISGFLSSLSSISIPSFLPVIATTGSIGAITGVSLLTIITVGGAFLEEGKGTTPSYIGTAVSPRDPSVAGHLAESVIWILNQCGIDYVNSSTWEDTENCIRASDLSEEVKTIIIEQFHYSVFNVGPGLQCVGFVRGIMAALGRDPGGGRHAKDYLDNLPSGYIIINDPKQATIGDLAVIRGGEYGHIGIIVNKEDNLIWLAQAFGDQNGLIKITKINPVYFDGFLRPQ
ncbi:MAG: CHAP domain-containing protein [Microgenomates group bacterium]